MVTNSYYQFNLSVTVSTDVFRNAAGKLQNSCIYFKLSSKLIPVVVI